MYKNKISYDELAKAKVTPTRNIVISTCSVGGFTIAQQLETKEEDGGVITTFMRGAFHINDIDGLHNLRNAIDEAIMKINEKK